ncbi:pentapeptide repeat-containing protein [Rhodococcus sp. NM-2]|uniref:pentapeptide repeat-containing protein n=1 Tax=Rhodococcus sp. NM-2 TaxID=3401174 RepID=UPI003AAA2A50
MRDHRLDEVRSNHQHVIHLRERHPRCAPASRPPTGRYLRNAYLRNAYLRNAYLRNAVLKGTVRGRWEFPRRGWR